MHTASKAILSLSQIFSLVFYSISLQQTLSAKVGIEPQCPHKHLQGKMRHSSLLTPSEAELFTLLLIPIIVAPAEVA